MGDLSHITQSFHILELAEKKILSVVILEVGWWILEKMVKCQVWYYIATSKNCIVDFHSQDVKHQQAENEA